MKMTKLRFYEEVVDIPNTLEGFKKWEFSSGSTTGQDYLVFHRLLIQSIKRYLPRGAKLVNVNRGHYYTSGFIEKDGKFVYFSISDVRGFPNEWYKNILIRTAEHEKDYTGGSNGYITLERFADKVGDMLGTDQPSLIMA
jgi:hypothetical protein